MLGTSLGLAVLVQVFCSTVTKQAAITLRPGPLTLGSAVIELRNPVLLLAVLFAFTLVIEVWLRYSRLGQAALATGENPTLAESWGLPVGAVFDGVLMLSFVTAGVGGALIAIHYSVSFGFAFKTMILCFAAVLLGGLGRLAGGVGASFVVAAACVALARLGLEPFVDSVVLASCALAYLVWPEGVLGRPLRQA